MSGATAGQAQGGAATSHPFTCNTCQVAYRNADLQKGHMKSEWHRYNLKRRVASLPPITAEAFTEKVLQARAQTTAEEDKAFFEKACEVCDNKTYYSENSYQNHLSSQKHRAREARAPSQAGNIPDEASSVVSSTFTLGDPVRAKGGDDDSVDASVEEEFNQVVEGLQKTRVSSDSTPSPVKRPSNPQASLAQENAEEIDRDSNSATPTPPQVDPATLLQQCLFCRYTSPTVRLNAHHMERFHGMIIPEKEYLVDLDGLIKHLCSRVYEDFECLTCGKVKANAFAVQTHMRDIGHCTIPYTTEEEQLDIGDFYDFRGTYSDSESEEDEDEDEGAEKKKASKADGEDEGWETDSSASSYDSEELTSVPADDRQSQYDRLDKNPHHSHHDPRAHLQPDGYHSHAHKHTRAVFHDEYELHLPSGKSVGHRSLNKYYRQNLHSHPTAEEREEREERRRLAIENGEEVEGEDGEKSRSRAVIPRPEQGILGISEQKKNVLGRELRKSRDVQHARVKKRDLATGIVHNNQKGYYYRYDGGG
ncbi:related to YBR267w [Cephalotrichum gorgonifer]|uniref:Related to YBR267w n=1 Tax=Cephalotrichum gorgonifer TaxID=2041049 RepID=A0AAE8SYA9_9PEZI|nr:related to YBR267w [Cephalotrichum gorgonifer]